MVVPSPRLHRAARRARPGGRGAARRRRADPVPRDPARAAPAEARRRAAIVIGVGGLGHVAVQLLKALSPARVVAVDRREEALEVAARSGADVVLPASGLVPAQLRGAAGGRGAALVARLRRQRRDARARRGRRRSRWAGLGASGSAGGTFPMRFGAVPLETLRDLLELGDARGARRGGRAGACRRRSRSRPSACPLADVPAAYERLAAGGCRGRLVAVPGDA